MFDVMLEFLNTFLIKGVDIYFGHKDKVYVINKQLIVDVFRVCADGYIKEPKGQVSQALQGCGLALANFSTYQWNTKSLVLPSYIRYLTIISIIYQKEKVQYFNNKNAININESRKRTEGRLGTYYIQQSV